MSRLVNINEVTLIAQRVAERYPISLNMLAGNDAAAQELIDKTNGYEFVMPDTKAYELIFDIATNKYLEPNEFVNIIKANVVIKY